MAFVKDFKGLIKGKKYFITIKNEGNRCLYDGVYKYTGYGELLSDGTVNGNADTCYAMFDREDGQELYLLRDIRIDIGDNTAYFRCLFDKNDKPFDIVWGDDADLCSHRNWWPCLVQEY